MPVRVSAALVPMMVPSAIDAFAVAFGVSTSYPAPAPTTTEKNSVFSTTASWIASKESTAVALPAAKVMVPVCAGKSAPGVAPSTGAGWMV